MYIKEKYTKELRAEIEEFKEIQKSQYGKTSTFKTRWVFLERRRR